MPAHWRAASRTSTRRAGGQDARSANDYGDVESVAEARGSPPRTGRGPPRRVVQRLGPRERALVALLALQPRRVVSPVTLISGVWGEEPPATATNTVQVHMSRIRRALGRDAVRGDSGGYRLDVAPTRVDVIRFDALTRDGAAAPRTGRPEVAAEALRAALDLWRGPALSDVDAPFASVERTRLEERRLITIENRVEADLAVGRAPEVVDELRVLVVTHPFRERLIAALMQALHRSGRRADALALYQDVRARFVEELGVEPGAEVRRAHAAVLADDPAPTPPSGPAPVRRRGTPIPVPVTATVGRATEVAALRTLLSRPDVRQVSLIGPGGVGKTRLAVVTANEAAGDYPTRRGVGAARVGGRSPGVGRGDRARDRHRRQRRSAARGRRRRTSGVLRVPSGAGRLRPDHGRREPPRAADVHGPRRRRAGHDADRAAPVGRAPLRRAAARAAAR